MRHRITPTQQPWIDVDDGLEYIEVCKECLSPDIGEVGNHDESLTICSNCRATEQGYKTILVSQLED